jgi:hypothetical protein
MFNLIKSEKTIQELEAYDNDQTCFENIFMNIEDAEKKPVKFDLNLVALSNVYGSEYGHSVLVKCETIDQYASLCEVEDLIDVNFSHKVDTKNFFNEEAFFLKLSIKGDKYKAEFDPPCEPKDFETSLIKGGSKLQVECKPGLWLNTKTNKAGMFLAISKITIDGGVQTIPKKSRKNRK